MTGSDTEKMNKVGINKAKNFDKYLKYIIL